MAEFRGIQADAKVFYVDAPILANAERIACTYALQYAQDGDVMIQKKVNGRWRNLIGVERGAKSAHIVRPEGIKRRGFASLSPEQRVENGKRAAAIRLAKKQVDHT